MQVEASDAGAKFQNVLPFALGVPAQAAMAQVQAQVRGSVTGEDKTYKQYFLNQISSSD